MCSYQLPEIPATIEMWMQASFAEAKSWQNRSVMVIKMIAIAFAKAQ